ncbi:MAG: LysE family translocator [Nitrospirae bacterium]|nr:LysE family translocator [Nitrospirota bacterium]
MGFIAAIPAGPVQIETVRRSINGHLKSSLMIVLGAFCVDILYGAIAFFGIAPFLEGNRVMAVFRGIGGLLLLVLSVVAIKHSLEKQPLDFSARHLKKKRWAFIGGISLSVANPMMILWWLSAVQLFKDIGLIHEFNFKVAGVFLAAGSLGLASYLVMLSLFLYWVKRFIPEERLRKLNLGFGILLLLIAVYFIFTSLRGLAALS